jgi:uncharacterized protein
MRIVCPICRRVIADAPDDHPSRPFCSPRCKLADLDNWLSGTYRIPTDDVDDDGNLPPN